MFNPLKYFRNGTVGLVLGSGGSKGISHISVIDYLLTLGIPINMIAGSSIGAVIGAIYCAGSLKEFTADIMDMSRSDMLSLIDPVISRSGLACCGVISWAAIPSPPSSLGLEMNSSASSGMLVGLARTRITKRSGVSGSR